MNKKNIFRALISIFIVFSVFYFLKSSSNKILTPENIKYVEIAGQKLKVELALTPFEQEKGLSGRENLNKNEGMLFVFPKLQRNYFWMKEMNFPIDMIWLGDNMQVIYIEKNIKPESFPRTFGPEEDSRYVLEVEASFSEKNNLKVGEKVKFLP